MVREDTCVPHLPLDVAGGFALGWTVGALVHLVAGAPSGRVTPDQVQEALRRAGIDVAAVRPAKVDSRGSTPFFAETGDGGTVFVKAVGPDQRDADMLFKLWRSTAFQNLDDEKPFRSAKRQIEVEALLDLLAARAGVRTPDVVALSELEDGTTLLAHRGLRASGLDTADAGRLSDAVLRDLWTQVALLHRARLAHRDLRLATSCSMRTAARGSWTSASPRPRRPTGRCDAMSPSCWPRSRPRWPPIAPWRPYRPWAPVRWPGRCPT